MPERKESKKPKLPRYHVDIALAVKDAAVRPDRQVLPAPSFHWASR